VCGYALALPREHPVSNSNSASRATPQVESVGILGVAVTFTLAVEVLFAEFGSGVSAATVAVLATVPDVPGLFTTSWTVATPLAGTVPREQLTVLAPVQDPCDGVAETNVVPAGRVSLTVTPAARLGPAFATARS
jgi:hypothetical protein